MNEAQQTGALEAMLFAHAEPVETERLADALRLSVRDTEELLHGLQQRYDEQESGLAILHFEPGPLADDDAALLRGKSSNGSWIPAATRRSRPRRWKCWR